MIKQEGSESKVSLNNGNLGGASSKFSESLMKRLQEFSSAPVLFVGAGISKRYLGLPGWEELLEELADKTKKDYAYYRSNADGEPPAIASLLSEPLRELLWTKEFEKIKESNKEHLVKRDSALKVLVAQRTLKLKQTNDKDLLKEIELFKKVVVDAIITTNYDLLIEDLFNDYQVYVGQDELLFSDPRGVGEIYKIHGSINDPNSLIFTKEDYEEYADRNPYLAAKLLTLFAEHPVIFIGYSMNDPNVIQILESLVRCLKPEHLSRIQDRLFFIHWVQSGKADISNTFIQIQGTNLPVININVPDFQELFSVLGSLKRKFDAHTLRRLKNHVYELILNNDPKGQLHVVADLEDESENKPDVVIGIGAIAALGKLGYRPISRADIILDVLHQTNRYDSDSILNHTISAFPAKENVPYIKYLVNAGFLETNGVLKNTDKLNPQVIERFNRGADPILSTKSAKKRARDIATKAGNFETLSKTSDYKHTLLALPELKFQNINAEKLRQYLIDHESESIKNGKCETMFSKAVCLYDRLIHLDSPW